MSVYKPKGSPFYHYDFQWRGRRFCGSTAKTKRADAAKVEQVQRERARLEINAENAVTGQLTLENAAGRYHQEVGKYLASADDATRDFARMILFFGGDKPLAEITNAEVARLVNWRRGHHVVRNPKAKLKDCPIVSNATVNRSTVELLKRLFRRAKAAWGASLPNEPTWKTHRLSEPQERVRELMNDEPEKLELATRADYAPFFAFAKASGLRLEECLLKWSEVDWRTARIIKEGKGGKRLTAPITSEIRAILAPLVGHHPVHVFTYVARRTREGRVKGQRYPLTYSGVKTAWRRLRKRAGVSDFRFHDFRHDLGTKLLRETGNLKLVQKALNHADIRTTTKYAHVLDTEVASALERVTESRTKSRNERKKVG